MALQLLSFRVARCRRVENLQRDWYVIYSKPHKEEQAQFHLGLKGVETFFPRLHLPGPLDLRAFIFQPSITT